FVTGSAPVFVAVGDFNGDGKPDVASADYGANTVSVLLNISTGAPSFAARRAFATGTKPIAVAVADFNGDGISDLAIANYQSNTVSVLLNTTPTGAAIPTFATQRIFATGTQP